VEAHAKDLRAEVQDREDGDALVEAVKTDYRKAPLNNADRAMLDYVVKLTLRPAEMTRDDVRRLRGHGFDDTAIYDIAQITALFAYYNRLADGLGIEDEPEWRSRG
jgi:uncharacterized peroxidase-related enzyme